MGPIHDDEGQRPLGSVSRRSAISGAIATGVTAIGSASTFAQGTPAATPAGSGSLDNARILELSARLCGGATLAENAVGGLATLLGAEPGIEDSLSELEAVAEVTPEAIGATSDEAQNVSTNILQYWFLGRYDGEPVENRSDIYFNFASWQALPYATQPSSCKAYGYWAVEIEL